MPTTRPAGLLGAYVIGLAFAFGWTPCIGPVLGAILAVAAGEDSVRQGVSLLFVYSLGLGHSLRRRGGRHPAVHERDAALPPPSGDHREGAGRLSRAHRHPVPDQCHDADLRLDARAVPGSRDHRLRSGFREPRDRADSDAMTAIALTIAGSDSSGGAGIQADLKTFAALASLWRERHHRAHRAEHARRRGGASSCRRTSCWREMRAVAADLEVRAIKIGMLGTSAVIEAVVEGLKLFPRVPVVLDPVMVAASGDPLLDARRRGHAPPGADAARDADHAEPRRRRRAARRAVAANEDEMAVQARKLLMLGRKPCCSRAVMPKARRGRHLFRRRRRDAA